MISWENFQKVRVVRPWVENVWVSRGRPQTGEKNGQLVRALINGTWRRRRGGMTCLTLPGKVESVTRVSFPTAQYSFMGRRRKKLKRSKGMEG